MRLARPRQVVSSGSDACRAEPARVPSHVGLIPDGNRRWARERGLAPADGYAAGIEPGLRMLEECRRLGIAEVSVYGFTKENVRRPSSQVEAFRAACVRFAQCAVAQGAALLAVGDDRSPLFPRELARLAHERARGDLRVNLLVNYGWRWDLLARDAHPAVRGSPRFGSQVVPRIDLVVRWGGCRRLSGFLPVQCAYADLCVLDALWPDARPDDLRTALAWYREQDVTMGG